jgi:hypothetical protein
VRVPPARLPLVAAKGRARFIGVHSWFKVFPASHCAGSSLPGPPTCGVVSRPRHSSDRSPFCALCASCGQISSSVSFRVFRGYHCGQPFGEGQEIYERELGFARPITLGRSCGARAGLAVTCDAPQFISAEFVERPGLDTLDLLADLGAFRSRCPCRRKLRLLLVFIRVHWCPFVVQSLPGISLRWFRSFRPTHLWRGFPTTPLFRPKVFLCVVCLLRPNIFFRVIPCIPWLPVVALSGNQVPA